MAPSKKARFFYQTEGYSLSTEEFKCAYCKRDNLMYVVCSGKVYEEQKYNDSLSEIIAEHEWFILVCNKCGSLNVIQRTQWDHDEYITDVTSDGTEIYEHPATTYYLYPNIDVDLPPPHEFMPKIVEKDYIEAQAVLLISPKSAAALCRLAIQKLCKYLGEKGQNINYDVGELVKKGLPIHIQQALDIVRVVGNEAVHPGEINFEDDREVAKELFGLINDIVDDRIGKVKRQERIREIYERLPQSKRDGISERDKQ